jgi:hypothetical protein
LKPAELRRHFRQDTETLPVTEEPLPPVSVDQPPPSISIEQPPQSVSVERLFGVQGEETITTLSESTEPSFIDESLPDLEPDKKPSKPKITTKIIDNNGKKIQEITIESNGSKHVVTGDLGAV